MDIRSFWKKASIEDRIVITRFIMGLIYGFIAYIVYRLGITIVYDVTTTIWILAAIVYSISIYYVGKKFNAEGLFLLLLRGLLTFYITWIALVLILYDLLG